MGLSKRPGLVMMDGSSDAGSFAVATTMIKLSTGNEYISQTCMTVSEFDGEIDRLIMKLKSIQSGGHAKVAAEYEREGTNKSPTPRPLLQYTDVREHNPSCPIDAEIDRLQQARAAIGGAPAAKKGPGRLAKATVASANKSGR